jgi:UDP-3-O-[3-hydroxymyristoyl] glucosamine N-acyltransferase
LWVRNTLFNLPSTALNALQASIYLTTRRKSYKLKRMKVREIAELVGGETIGDEELEVRSAASIESAAADQLTFFEKDLDLPETRAACVIIGMDLRVDDSRSKTAFVRVKDPKLAFARACSQIHPPKHRKPRIHPSAIIADSADIGNDVFVGAYVCVGEKSRIGDGSQLRAGAKIGDGVAMGTDCVIHPNVFIEDGCTLGDRVILHASCIIGADGFGYVRSNEGYIKFPQIGSVIIEDDVEIGANTCIDRGALGTTRIGSGTKIDNLVQVGHNVDIGKRCVIAAQTGISGSVTIEDDCVIGGQVGFGDHVRVLSGAVIGSQAGILPGKIVRPGVWWGTPIQPLDEYKRQNAHVKGLGRLKEEVKKLSKLVDRTRDDG